MTASKRAAAVAAIVLLPSLVPAVAYAQSEDQGLAQTLFDEGLKLMDEGKYAAACPKLAESQKLDPGGGTLINLALCREKEGKLASAWAAYNEALSLAIRDGRKERADAARERLADITPKLAKLTIVVPAETMGVAGLEVRFDKSPVRQAAWGVATPVDIGKHEVSATAPGKLPWSIAFDIMANGEVKSIEVGTLKDAPVEPKPVGNVDLAPGPKDTTLAWVVGGVGVAGIVVGVVTGAMVFGKKSDSDLECKNGCTQRGVDLMNSAYTFAWVSDVSLALGLAGIGVSAILFLTAKPSEPARAVTIVPTVGPGSLGLVGRF